MVQHGGIPRAHVYSMLASQDASLRRAAFILLEASNPSLRKSTSYQFVETKQVAPTILRILGLDPNKLEAVQKEGTAVLPGLRFGGDDD